jgi:hypothetical protein
MLLTCRSLITQRITVSNVRTDVSFIEMSLVIFMTGVNLHKQQTMTHNHTLSAMLARWKSILLLICFVVDLPVGACFLRIRIAEGPLSGLCSPSHPAIKRPFPPQALRQKHRFSLLHINALKSRVCRDQGLGSSDLGLTRLEATIIGFEDSQVGRFSRIDYFYAPILFSFERTIIYREPIISYPLRKATFSRCYQRRCDLPWSPMGELLSNRL